jgi:membrane protein DedA with SNARE-associated domain
MTERVAVLVGWLTSIPDWLLYLLIGLAAALENIVPPLPADLMIVVGGVIAGAGTADPNVVFLMVWLGNVGSALLVYAVGKRYGAAFFARPVGRFLLAPAQIRALDIAYRRFGFPIIFFSRFLPVFRPIVPVFAGVARLAFWRTAVPIAAPSAIWYGLLVYLGVAAGENWRLVMDLLKRVGGWLWVLAAIVLGLVIWWWLRTRSPRDEEDGP